jgi:iron(III) transport system permease protein
LEQATTTSFQHRSVRSPKPPLFVWVPTAAISLVMLLPLTYLVVRTASAGTGAWGLIFNASTAAILARSIILVTLVTLVSVVIGVSIAWLTTRADIPLRRWFTVLSALPLVIPSYVFALMDHLGPEGNTPRAA